MKHFLKLSDFTTDELVNLLKRGIELKKLHKLGKCPKPLQGKVLGMIFEKSSTRTRVSFEVGAYHLGGYGIYLNQQISQLGRGESYADTARVLSRYVDMVLLRTFSEERLLELAKYSDVPVINGLTDMHHPCQILTDMMTIHEKKQSVRRQVITYVGDGNNMAHSWVNAAKAMGFELRIATPKNYEMHEAVIEKTKEMKNVLVTNDPVEAVTGSDVIYTDTWFSMGQEVTEQKKKAFLPFQVNQELVSKANSGAIIMHCLPAHRGEEITDEVMDGPQSVIFDEAENRLYAQMAILESLVS